MKRILQIAALLLTAVSCEIHFDLDNVSEPRMYVQYLPSPDSAYIEIAYAEPAFGNISNEKYVFLDSDLGISVNGQDVPVNYLSEQETIELGFKAPDGGISNVRYAKVLAPKALMPGDKIDLRLDGRGVKTAFASTSIPPRPAISDVTVSPVQADSSEAFKVVMQLQENVPDDHYYGLKALIRTTTVIAHNKLDQPSEDAPEPLAENGFPGIPGIPGLPDIPGMPEDIVVDTLVQTFYTIAGQLASTADLNSLDLDGFANINYYNGFLESGIFGAQPMMLLPGKMFTDGAYSFYINSLDSSLWGSGLDFSTGGDTLINGPVSEDGPAVFSIVLSRKNEFRLELYRLSDELYNYCKARYLETFNMLSNFGVTPPNFTYTNVYNGLGIVGGLCGTVTPWYEITAPEN